MKRSITQVIFSILLIAISILLTSCNTDNLDTEITTTNIEDKTTPFVENSPETTSMQINQSGKDDDTTVNTTIEKTEIVIIDGLADATLNEQYFSAIRAAMQEKNKVVAIINGKPIYGSRFLLTKANMMFANRGEMSLSDKEILDKLIRSELFYLAAAEQGIKYDEQTALSLAQSNIEQMKSNAAFFVSYLSAYGYTESEYLEEIELPMHRNSQLYSSFIDKILTEAGADRGTNEAEKILESKTDELYNKYNVTVE